MHKRLILDSRLLDITITRLCQQLIENHDTFEQSVILGLQPKGTFLAKHIQSKLQELTGKEVPTGYLDTTFYRDDFRRRETPLLANTTHVPFIIENKKVILIDDVLFTGRSIRAALDAMIAFGRPRKVELLVLIDRKYSRDLPIEPHYVGQHVNTILSQRVLVEWTEKGATENAIWLVDTQDIPA
ncbi:bifunctional pyr operon transcriptional regulator/uracil phosphoribosyltransferase PyrR [Cytophagaceae bacterium YF14B1]|uniref:Bifunctional pyr operon transcriptional regulator/uracil phosphoribosyltransferase PyrR n=1 Tax=Xanthocytophaga flava TaxID=3048013 RepID=A0AAE3QRM1_9BACT|nr:bifunctional pyr operon transcriptional regulator/uracil phosphoribosyltransferase PyrR [Xanthocytophaga flavus]MDJ1483666.1 bifunctional pyr operon transcriptional regulator/uracil phosphoribosyltransferase PyrR [Xanthocytophaga flavus]